MTRIGQIAGAAFGLWLAGAGALLAETRQAVVVELFTSQGCSSCPPADEYLGKLADDPDVIALALHVDYWDYIGWIDKFGSPQFTARQKAYAHAGGDDSIYTPEMIVNGEERVVGSESEAVEKAIRRHMGLPQTVSLSLTRDVAMVTIKAAAKVALDGPFTVQLIRYRPSETVAIRHGENAGKVIEYHNIVTNWQVLGEWAGDAPLEMMAPAVGDDPIVVILQKTSARASGPGTIVAAATLR